MTSLADRVDIDLIRARAEEIRPGRAVLNLFAMFFFAVGWLVGMAFMAVSWSTAAVSVGYHDVLPERERRRYPPGG